MAHSIPSVLSSSPTRSLPPLLCLFLAGWSSYGKILPYMYISLLNVFPASLWHSTTFNLTKEVSEEDRGVVPFNRTIQSDWYLPTFQKHFRDIHLEIPISLVTVGLRLKHNKNDIFHIFHFLLQRHRLGTFRALVEVEFLDIRTHRFTESVLVGGRVAGRFLSLYGYPGRFLSKIPLALCAAKVLLSCRNRYRSKLYYQANMMW